MRDDPTEKIDQLFAEYLDRLNAGEKLDPLNVLYEHPNVGPALLEKLEAFIDLAQDSPTGQPLGTLGDYTLRRQIGRGGMGVVYEAWENSMDRRVALKVLPPGVAADERALQRFVREAKTAGQLNHPNVVSVYGMGLREQTPYYAMEFVDGETLAQILTRLNDADPRTATPFGAARDELAFYLNVAKAFADVADGLQHAHSKGVIHRDIKPSNLILDREGRLRILDFGLARLEGQESITVSGDIVGTVQYMSPEQAQVKKIAVDHRTDVYSLGATMYELLTLRSPFKGRDHHDTLTQIITRDAEPPHRLNARVPRDLETIVLKCMRKDPRDRYGTAEALGQDLRRFAHGDPVEARPESGFERVRRHAWTHRAHLVIAAGLVTILVLGLTLAMVFLRQHRQEQTLLYDRLLLEGIARSQVPTVAGIDDSQVAEHLKRIQESAVRSFREAANILPDRPEAWWQLGRTLESVGQTAEARAALDRALAARGDFVPAVMAKLRVGVEKPDDGDVAKQLENLRPRYKEPWQGLLIDVALAENRADSAAAERLYSELLDYARRGEPYHGFVFENLVLRGRARMQIGRTLAATQDFLEARWRAPEILSASLLLAASYYALDADVDAHAVLDEAQRRFPGPDARLAIADVALRFHDLDRALAAAHDLPAESRLATRTRILCRAGRNAEAVDAGRAAIASGVRNPELYADMAESLLNLKRLDEAEATLVEGLKAYPENPMLQRFLHVRVGYFRCRHKELVDYELGRPPSERDYRTIAWCQYRLGRYEEALSAFQQLIDQQPNDADARFARSWAHYSNGEMEAAVTDSLDATRLSKGTYFLAVWSIAKFLDSPSCRHAVLPHWSELDRLLSTPEARRIDNALWLGLRAVAKASCSTPDGDDARRIAEQGVTVTNGCDGQVLSRFAEVLYVGGQIAEAVRVLEKARGTRNRPGMFENQLKSYRAALGDGIATAASIDDLVIGLPGIGTPDFATERDTLRSRVAKNAPALSGYLEGLLLEYFGDADGAVRLLEKAVLDQGMSENAAAIRLARLYAATARRDAAIALLEQRLLGNGAGSLDAWEAWLEIVSRDRETSLEGMLARVNTIQNSCAAGQGAALSCDDVRLVLSRLNEDGAIRINCGGADLVDSRGQEWLADRFFEGGFDGLRFVPTIQGTNAPALFAQQRVFWMDFEHAPGYRIPLPVGTYELTLLFVESVMHPKPIRFAIECEGQLLDPDFLVNEKGFGVAQQRTFGVKVEDGALDLVLRPKPWISVISGIEIRPEK